MDTKINYAVVGLFVILLTSAIVITSIWIAGGHHVKHYRNYLAYINQSVGDLTDKSPIRFNGVNVGFVDSISLNPSNPQQVRIVLKIEDSTPINESTVASIQSQGFTGFTFVNLQAEKVQAPPLKKSPDEPYPVIRSLETPQASITGTLNEVTEKFNQVSDNINVVFGKDNQEAIKEILDNLEAVTDTLDRNTVNMDASLKSTKELLANAEKASKRLPKSMDNLDRALISARKAADSLSSVGKTANSTMRKGDRAIEDIEQQILPNVQIVIDKLNRILTNLEQVSDDLRDNPSILVRGKAAARKGPGE